MSSGRAAALLEWYRATERDVPWRHTSDPYLVLVGEVMAQQTPAARAAAHYRPFIQRFGDVDALAAASLREVLALWAGLGYNSRAKRLRDAAVIISSRGWPDDLTDLPGVGPYTAAAVDCFARGAEVAVVDTNVRRVLGRWRGSVLAPDASAEARLQLRPPAADWNQALMDLGASVCVGRDPRCGECPVSRWCAGPDTYLPPPRQRPYEGSLRQARSAVLLHLAHRGPTSMVGLQTTLELRPRLIADAAAALVAEGLVVDATGQLDVVD